MPILRVYRARIEFRVVRSTPLVSYSGVFAGKIVYDAAAECGFHPRGGWFRASPVYDEEGHRILGGRDDALEPGRLYRFQASFWGEQGAQMLRAFTGCATSLEYAVVDSISVETVTVEVPEPRPVETDGDCAAAYVVVEHEPSFYRFQGAVIAYPSPRRMITSVARRIGELTRRDYRGVAEALADATELVYWKGRRLKLTMSHNVVQPAFEGAASYYTVTTPKLLEYLRAFYRLAGIIGLGGSPGQGTGWVKRIHDEKPPFEPPCPQSLLLIEELPLLLET